MLGAHVRVPALSIGSKSAAHPRYPLIPDGRARRRPILCPGRGCASGRTDARSTRAPPAPDVNRPRPRRWPPTGEDGALAGDRVEARHCPLTHPCAGGGELRPRSARQNGDRYIGRAGPRRRWRTRNSPTSVSSAPYEAGISIDTVGGSSMGAVMGAQLALGLTPDEMIDSNVAGWTRRRRLDFGVPTVAVLRGRGAMQGFDGFFGATQIEDRNRAPKSPSTRRLVSVNPRRTEPDAPPG